MSLVFSQTASPYKGIIQQIELETGMNLGDISGNSEKLGIFTTQINLAWDDYVSLALQSSGKWQFDDSNQTDNPIIYADLVSSQRNYTWDRIVTGKHTSGS